MAQWLVCQTSDLKDLNSNLHGNSIIGLIYIYIYIIYWFILYYILFFSIRTYTDKNCKELIVYMILVYNCMHES